MTAPEIKKQNYEDLEVIALVTEGPEPANEKGKSLDHQNELSPDIKDEIAETIIKEKSILGVDLPTSENQFKKEKHADHEAQSLNNRVNILSSADTDLQQDSDSFIKSFEILTADDEALRPDPSIKTLDITLYDNSGKEKPASQYSYNHSATLAKKGAYKIIEQEHHEEDLDEDMVVYLPEFDEAKYTTLKAMAIEECFAHEIIYKRELETKEMLSIACAADSKNELYNIKKIQTEIPGLVAYIFTSQDINNPCVRVVFRGTQCRDSAIRDLEANAGEQTFNQEKDNIVQQVSRAVEECYRATCTGVQLIFSGHSLGGADAQRATAEALKQISENKTYEAVKKISTYYFNSPGVSIEDAKQCDHYAQKLSEDKSGISINCHGLLVSGDIVQQAGAINIFSKIDHALVESSITKIDLPNTKNSSSWINVFATLATAHRAHTAKNFYRPKDAADLGINYVHHSNRNTYEKEHVAEQLTYKTTLETYTAVKIAKSLIHSFISWTFGPKPCTKLSDPIISEAQPSNAKVIGVR